MHLALYIGEYKLMNIDFSEGGGIQDVMQTLLKQAGLDRKQIAAIFTEEDLKDDRVLQFLSTYISSGELPLVFSNDEEHGIYQVYLLFNMLPVNNGSFLKYLQYE